MNKKLSVTQLLKQYMMLIVLVAIIGIFQMKSTHDKEVQQ